MITSILRIDKCHKSYVFMIEIILFKQINNVIGSFKCPLHKKYNTLKKRFILDIFHHRFNHSSVSFTRYNQTLIFWGSIFHFSIWCFDHFGKLIEKHKWNISHVLLYPVDNFALMRVWSERYFFLIWKSPLLAKLIENKIFLNQSIKIIIIW